MSDIQVAWKGRILDDTILTWCQFTPGVDELQPSNGAASLLQVVRSGVLAGHASIEIKLGACRSILPSPDLPTRGKSNRYLGDGICPIQSPSVSIRYTRSIRRLTWSEYSGSLQVDLGVEGVRGVCWAREWGLDLSGGGLSRDEQLTAMVVGLREHVRALTRGLDDLSGELRQWAQGEKFTAS